MNTWYKEVFDLAVSALWAIVNCRFEFKNQVDFSNNQLPLPAQ